MVGDTVLPLTIDISVTLNLIFIGTYREIVFSSSRGSMKRIVYNVLSLVITVEDALIPRTHGWLCPCFGDNFFP